MEAKGGAFAGGAAPSPPPLPGLPFAILLFLRIAVKDASIPADATFERFTQIKGPLLRAIRAKLEGPEAAAVALKIAALYPPADRPLHSGCGPKLFRARVGHTCIYAAQQPALRHCELAMEPPPALAL